MKSQIKYFIGVDGGGSGTRVLIASPEDYSPLSHAEGGPSALGLGVEKAWAAIMNTIAKAFANGHMSVPMLSECAIGLGLSGANNILWKNEFILRNPGFKKIFIDTDGYTTLLGAHGGKAGVIVAVGTGSVGMVLRSNGERESVSGWGFPAGDEASGAWLGLKAAALTQKSFDHRKLSTALTDAVKNFCGTTPEPFLHWLGRANQNSFAQLAPLIFETAPRDAEAYELLIKAGREIHEMVIALDPSSQYPLSICGRLGEALIEYLPADLKKRHQPPRGDSTVGALHLISQNLK